MLTYSSIGARTAAAAVLHQIRDAEPFREAHATAGSGRHAGSEPALNMLELVRNLLEHRASGACPTLSTLAPEGRGLRPGRGSVTSMLVLSRRVGESIVIGDSVTVTVLEVRGDVVRVGID